MKHFPCLISLLLLSFSLCFLGCPNEEIPDPPEETPDKPDPDPDPDPDPEVDSGTTEPPGPTEDAGTTPTEPTDAGQPVVEEDAGQTMAMDAGEPPAPEVDSGQPMPPVIEDVYFNGTVQPFHYLGDNAQSGVEVKIVNIKDSCEGDGDCRTGGTCTNSECVYPASLPCYSSTNTTEYDPFCYTSDASGFQFNDLPPGSLLHFFLSAPGETLFASRTQAFIGNEDISNKTISYVDHTWFSALATECSVPGFAEGNVTVYSHLVGRLVDAQGSGVAGISQTEISVDLDGNTNTHGTGDTDAFVCFLESYDNAGTDQLRGTTETASQTGGYFAIFRLDNGSGTGLGTASISVTNASADFNENVVGNLNAGHVGVVQLQATTVIENVALMDFETDIVPIFANYGCTACHSVGGPAALGDNPLLLGGADADTMYDSLFYPDTTCEVGSTAESLKRLCVDAPLSSKLIKKPLYEYPPDHPNSSFSNIYDDPVQKIRLWVEQGAPRYAEMPDVEYDAGPGDPPPETEYTLQGVMDILGQNGGAGCTGCHYANRAAITNDPAEGPEGGLALDDCLPDYDYAAQGIDPNHTTNPNAALDCVHYHLVTQTGQLLTNTTTPADSLLLTKPLASVVDGHDLKAFPNIEDYRYQYIYMWIDAGALKTSD